MGGPSPSAYTKDLDPSRSSNFLLADSALSHCEKLTWDDIQVSKLLGRGAFSQVQMVTVLTTNSTSSSSLRTNDSSCYAIKRILPHFNSPNDLRTSMICLQLEARILSKLLGGGGHENIISMVAVGGGGDQGMFLVLERLLGTLDTAIEEWKRKEQGVVGISFRRRKVVLPVQHQRERLEFVALPIAHALEYLHGKRIVFRDLKPDNIGFGADETIKLFDFGMAEKIRSDRSTSDGLEGLVGTLRYMSPECHGHKRYGLPSDVYSFGLLLWEIMSLEKPFHNFSSAKLAVQKKSRTMRPKLSKRIPLQQLMAKCWDQDPAQRPSMTEVVRDIDAASACDDSTVSSYSESSLSSFHSNNNNNTPTKQQQHHPLRSPYLKQPQQPQKNKPIKRNLSRSSFL